VIGGHVVLRVRLGLSGLILGSGILLGGGLLCGGCRIRRRGGLRTVVLVVAPGDHEHGASADQEARDQEASASSDDPLHPRLLIRGLRHGRSRRGAVLGSLGRRSELRSALLGAERRRGGGLGHRGPLWKGRATETGMLGHRYSI